MLPQAQYNDRPIGIIFLYTLFKLFGLNSFLDHLVLLALHLFNTLLVYLVVNKFLIYLAKPNHIIPWLSAIIFGVWPKSLFAIQWDAAIFDLLAATITLIILNLFLDNKLGSRYQGFNNILVIILYYTALRTKEITIGIPIIILLIEIIPVLSNYRMGDWIKKIRISNTILALLCIMLVYFSLLMYLGRNNAGTANVNSPYYYHFSIIAMIKNYLKYISLYYDYSSFNFMFTKFTVYSYLFIVLFFAVLLYSVYKLFRNNPILITFFFFFTCMIAPVLPMVNMQHVLYLYVPSIFLGVILALLINDLLVLIQPKPLFLYSGLILVVGLLLSLNYLRSVVQFRTGWLSMGQGCEISISDLKKLPTPPKGTTIYINNIQGFNVFSVYGPGFVNNIIFNDPTIKTVLNPSNIVYTNPYFVLNYNNFHVNMVARSK